MSYREWAPPPALTGVVRCLWAREVAADGNVDVLPDGCVDLVLRDGAVVVAGPDTGPVPTPVRAGERILGLRLHPGAAGAALGSPAHELRDLRVPLDDLWGRAARGSDDLDALVAALAGREVVVEIVGLLAEEPASGNVSRELFLLGAQAVVRVMGVVDWQEASRLGHQAEQHPVEQHKGVVKGPGKLMVCRFGVAEKPLSDQRDGGEDLSLEGFAHFDGICGAFVQSSIKERTATLVWRERLRGEEGDEVAEVLLGAAFEQFGKIDLVAGAFDQVACFCVEAPPASVGQDAPSTPGDRDVVDDLCNRILVAGLTVKWPIEALRVGDGCSVAKASAALEPVGFAPAFLGQKQRVVRLAAARRPSEVDLNGVGEPQRAQDRLDEALLRLRFVS